MKTTSNTEFPCLSRSFLLLPSLPPSSPATHKISPFMTSPTPKRWPRIPKYALFSEHPTSNLSFPPSLHNTHSLMKWCSALDKLSYRLKTCSLLTHLCLPNSTPPSPPSETDALISEMATFFLMPNKSLWDQECFNWVIRSLIHGVQTPSFQLLISMMNGAQQSGTLKLMIGGLRMMAKGLYIPPRPKGRRKQHLPRLHLLDPLPSSHNHHLPPSLGHMPLRQSPQHKRCPNPSSSGQPKGRPFRSYVSDYPTTSRRVNLDQEIPRMPQEHPPRSPSYTTLPTYTDLPRPTMSFPTNSGENVSPRVTTASKRATGPPIAPCTGAQSAFDTNRATEPLTVEPFTVSTTISLMEMSRGTTMKISESESGSDLRRGVMLQRYVLISILILSVLSIVLLIAILCRL